MTIRTTEQLVKEVLDPGGDFKPGKSLLPFITAANNLVNWIQSNAVAYGRVALDTATAKSVETWLAAWAYKCSDQQYSSSSNKASASFRGATGGKGLEMNNYGSAAKAMDVSGLLRAWDEGKIVGTVWLGKVPTEQVDYTERR